MNENKIYKTLLFLASFGILLSLYLLWQQMFTPEFQPCTINSWINCDAVISGEVAKTLGIPTPLYGLIGYVVILFAAFKRMPKLLLGISAFGLLFCLYIAVVELVFLRVICPVCIGCQITMIWVFALSILVFQKSKNIDSADESEN